MSNQPPAFLCDEMLGRLARRLRAAGYDTALVEPGQSDRALLRRALRENRTVLTCDQKILEHRAAAGNAVLLESGRVEGQIRSLSGTLKIDWMLAPFSRCLVDNAPVRPATDDEIAAISDGDPGVGGPYTTCPECGRSYWWGGHTRRMIEKLEAWAGRTPTPFAQSPNADRP